MIYLSNAFSLQMISSENDYNVHVATVTPEEVKAGVNEGFTSAIGHLDTANVVSDIIGTRVPMNRISLALGRDDILYVAQLVGGRLPEGSTTLPDGFSIAFKRVTLC